MIRPVDNYPYVHIKPIKEGGYKAEIFFSSGSGRYRSTFTKWGAQRWARKQLTKHLKYLQRLAVESEVIR